MTQPPSFLKSVPRKSIFIFLLGVFLIFTTTSVASDVGEMGRHGAVHYAIGTLLIALFSVAYAFWGFRLGAQCWKAFIPLFLLEVALMSWLGNTYTEHPLPSQMNASEIATLHSRLQLDGYLTLIGVILGYFCFVFVSIAEGRRYARVHTEMLLAAEIHRVLVPPIDTGIGAFEFCARSQPSGEVGGDLVDVFAHNQNWIAYVADVSGHGVAPGVVMAMVKSAARMHLSSSEKDGTLLERLNDVLYPIKKPEMYATFAYLACNDGQLEYCTAGHPSILHFHAATGEVSELECSNFPVGMFNHRQFDTGSVAAQPADLFLMFTDGVAELTNKQDEEFGVPAIKKLLSLNATRPLAEILSALIDATNLHGTAEDDRSVLLVKCARH